VRFLLLWCVFFTARWNEEDSVLGANAFSDFCDLHAVDRFFGFCEPCAGYFRRQKGLLMIQLTIGFVGRFVLMFICWLLEHPWLTS